MYAIDPIDSLLAIYENPLPTHQERSNFDEHILALDDHLRILIKTHSGKVTDRAKASLVIQCMILRNYIGQYIDLVNPEIGRGN